MGLPTPWTLPTEPGSGSTQPGPDLPPVEQNPPDGHTYLVQKSPNSSGLTWVTLTTDNNATDATNDYNYYVGQGYFMQVLRDGSIWLTNLAEADRTQGGVQGQGDGHTYTLQIWGTPANETATRWIDVDGWVGDKAAAIAASKAYAQANTGRYRLVNEKGQVIWSQNTMPPGGPGTGSWDLPDILSSLVPIAVGVGVAVVIIMILRAGVDCPPPCGSGGP